MNPIQQLRADLASARDALELHHAKYYWLKGYGTGWCGAHYGISEEEYQGAYARTTALRGRILVLQAEIARLTQVSGARQKTSLLTHGRF